MIIDFCSICFLFLIFSYYVYYLAVKHQGKFHVCDNLPGNKPDSDEPHL